jgi:6-pyruvoyl-tetrahydropterin synthase
LPKGRRSRAITVYSLYIDSYFWAGHSVSLPDGSPEPVHNHNFCATAKLTSETLNDKAMVMDFYDFRQSLDNVTADIAQAGNIGRIGYFAKKGQTAEIIAQYIFERLKTVLPAGVILAEVTVSEEPQCRASYSEWDFRTVAAGQN